MKSNQLKIFISSTFVDLEDTRNKILKFLGVLNSDLISMEVFGSDEQGSVEVCLKNIEDSNFFIGIYAERYGYIEPESGLSLTELEYHRAYEKLQRGELKGLLLYVLHPESNWPLHYVDREPEPFQKLKTFKDLISSRHTLTFFKEKTELPFDILRDTIRKLEIGVEETYRPRQAKYIPEQDKLERPLGMGFFSTELASLFHGRSTEIRELNTQIIQYRFSLLIGVSGIGKTSLLNAGIIPGLKKIGWKTCVTRPLNDPLENLRRSIWTQMIDEVLPGEFGLEDVIRTVLDVNHGTKILIVIDQFDDILNNKDHQEIDKIIIALNQLYLLNHPDLHLLISYRGDVESEIGMVWQKISGAADGLPRYYLSPLEKPNAREIIVHTLKDLTIDLEKHSLLEQIIEDIEQESHNNGHLGVFPPFIQMIISTIHANLNDNLFSEIAYNELGRSKEIISNYLYNLLNYLGTDKQNGIRFLVSLVSNYGTKTQKSIEEISSEIEISEVQIQPILLKLLDLRLIRPLEFGYEITHDLLARTILNGLMTDEEKDIRRFKYLLESKAQAFTATSSILSYAEHLHIYKYRKRISCNDLEFKLLAISGQENRLPIGFWLTSENLGLLSLEETFRIEQYIGALQRLTPGFEECPPEYEEHSDNAFPIDLKKLAWKNTEHPLSNLFEMGLNEMKPDNGYRISDKTKYKTLFAAITIAKHGIKDDLKTLMEFTDSAKTDKKQKYIGFRSIICLSNKFKIPLSEKFLYNYTGRHWKSCLIDLNPNLFKTVKLRDIFELIETNSKDAPYVDYLVALISKFSKPTDYPDVLAFIKQRVSAKSSEQLFDKYLILALNIGADFDYFISLLKDAHNTLGIKYTTLLHQRIADLASERDYLMLISFIDRMLALRQKDKYGDPTGGLMLNDENQYFYVWVMGCAFCNICRKEDITTLVELLTFSFYTIRKAAFDRLAKTATEEDLKYLIQAAAGFNQYGELTSLLALLDSKLYLYSNFEEFWGNNNLRIQIPNSPPVVNLLPKTNGRPSDPEKATEYSFSYIPGEEDDMPF
jgi:hypothetical protein